MNYADIQNYTEYLFKLALKKCGNLQDAEDLTQETILCALQVPHDVADTKSWLSSVLIHKFYDGLRKKYRMPTVSLNESVENLPDDHLSENETLPDESDVRREVAFLAEKYRTVIVRHYLYGEKVQEIADSLGVPKGTVLSRLSWGREQIRKGFDKMKPYDTLSYQPEKLDVSCHGCQGFHEEPWSLVANDLLKQNILIAAYEQPLAVTEIAQTLGIPTAYIENAVAELTRSELMKQAGSRFFTDFMINSPEQVLKGLDAEIALVERHYDELLLLVKAYWQELMAPAFLAELLGPQKEKLAYYFLLHLFSNALYVVMQRIVPSKEEYPQRPDGGRWIAMGSRYPADFDFENYRFYRYCYGGERRSYDENYLGAKSIDLHIYDTQPDLNKHERGPHGIKEWDLVKLLYVLSRNVPFAYSGIDAILLESIPHLIDCGILEKREGKPVVAVPILTPEEYGTLDKIRLTYMRILADKLEPWLREILPELKIEIPKHLVGRIAEFRQYSCYAIPMAFVKKMIAQKDFDDRNAVPPMVFVVDDDN